MFEFTFAHPPNPAPVREIFFIPERRIPDSFFSTLDSTADFTIQEFAEFRFVMDTGGVWVRKMLAIIDEFPEPRCSRQRRTLRATDLESPTADKVRRNLGQLFSAGVAHLPPPDPQPVAAGSREITAFQRRLFYGILDQCAAR